MTIETNRPGNGNYNHSPSSTATAETASKSRPAKAPNEGTSTCACDLYEQAATWLGGALDAAPAIAESIPPVGGLFKQLSVGGLFKQLSGSYRLSQTPKTIEAITK